jgi:integrase/recombinase XerC
MSELSRQIDSYLSHLRRENASVHTVRSYESDLAQFLQYLTPLDAEPPAAQQLDLLTLREWLGGLYRQNLTAVTLRRKLAAVRSFFQFLTREGILLTNTAKLLRTPKAPQTLPRVQTAEQTNDLVNQVAEDKLDRDYPERDLLIFELLYGCGLRVSELVGLNVEDLDRTERWLRVLGKGKKERQVPYGGKAAEALDLYLPTRRPAIGTTALLLNFRGGRLLDGSVRRIVKLHASLLSGDSSLHPHGLRHAYATHLLSDGADLRSIQELLGHALLSTTQKYTQVSLTDLMATYDRAHPKAKG